MHLVGPKDTGKSTVFKVGNGIFGLRHNNGYAGLLPSSAIVKSYSGANFAQAQAHGVRFLTLSEPSTQRTDAAFLKNLAGGGEPIVTEGKGLDPYEWEAECVTFIGANSVVRFDTRDEALSERINILEFVHKIKSVDTDFVDKLLVAEGGLILKWIIEGAKRYDAQGHINVPQSVQDRAVEHVVASSGPLRWLEEMVEAGEYEVRPAAPRSNFVKRPDAWRKYNEWCFDNNEKPRSQGEWQAEIHAKHNAPESAMKRSDGSHRLYGVCTTDAAPMRFEVHQGGAVTTTAF